MIDQEKLKRLRICAQQADGADWAWDDGTLIELGHESAVGVECSIAAGGNAAPHISQADPATVLALLDELEAVRKVVEAAVLVLNGRGVVSELRSALERYQALEAGS